MDGRVMMNQVAPTRADKCVTHVARYRVDAVSLPLARTMYVHTYIHTCMYVCIRCFVCCRNATVTELLFRFAYPWHRNPTR
jgi:hypothetical protein